MLKDSYGRTINYLRLAVTDRCNLRCYYCMPEHGLEWLNRSELLSYEEMLRLCQLCLQLGINKIRITGGEPFVRKGIGGFLEKLSRLPGLDMLTLTTNGVRTAHYVAALRKAGITQVNLSLDTLDKQRFFEITRRDDFDAVMDTLYALIEQGIAVKINAVVMAGKNTGDILSLASLAQTLPVSVRFIEEMPFNGGSEHKSADYWDHNRIFGLLQQQWPSINKLTDQPGSTAYAYHVPDFAGSLGIIAAYTRTFCGSCNRLRITPQGILKTCLYDNGGLDLRQLLRDGADDEALKTAISNAVAGKAKDGFEAEASITGHESMARIGG